ncbi:MAG: bifunctional phosphoribosylaminoimidazolecarboxamide formyltransferase/inosine monophosphate cyclohydrolase [Acidobacteria bacterium]|nr:bifunctional phosphoribosylaminoimidazolecarboxamide formyltransferase/inosine monophosphate cyclohydrolase [Acidobacteriota bacterium]
MRALLSVSDKTGVVTLARGLLALGFELVSTGGTGQALRDADLSFTSVGTVTGLPEMMDGRVKTLHPAVHAGILARRDREDDLEVLRRHAIETIDVVVVNLYPFANAAKSADTPFDRLIEEIDIGGPTLVRAAAKNFRDVLILIDPNDYDSAIRELSQPGGPSLDFRFGLAQKAFRHTAEYDRTISDTLECVRVSQSGFERETSMPELTVPSSLTVSLSKLKALRYGENPHQEAAWYSEQDGVGLSGAQALQGKELSFTNLLDLDAAARLLLEFEEPAAAVLKHTTPCGVATAASIVEAYIKARETDPLSAFGGIVGLNRPIDVATATAITSTFIEGVVAPGVDNEAVRILSKKQAMRVLTVDLSSVREGRVGRRDVRSILGGWLLQCRDVIDEAAQPWNDEVPNPSLRVVTKRVPSDEEWRALRFAWRVSAHAKSNAVVFARGDRTVSLGAGQMSRVDAVNIAVLKAGEKLGGTVVASDGFFPFRDSLDAIAKAGATAVVQPGGSKRDAEVVAAADEHDIAMVMTGRRHFWH